MSSQKRYFVFKLLQWDIKRIIVVQKNLSNLINLTHSGRPELICFRLRQKKTKNFQNLI